MSICAQRPTQVFINTVSLNELDHRYSEALKKGNFEQALALVRQGCNINAKVNISSIDVYRITFANADREMTGKLMLKLINQTNFSNLPEEGLSCIHKCINRLQSNQPLPENFATHIWNLLEDVYSIVFEPSDWEVTNSNNLEISLIDLAVTARNLDLIKELLSLGAQLSDRYSLLSVGFFTKQSAEIIEFMLERGYTLNDFIPENEFMDLTVCYALQADDYDMLDFLVDHGEDVSAERFDRLMREREEAIKENELISPNNIKV